jgi:ATP-dependent DNA helicase DinG
MTTSILDPRAWPGADVHPFPDFITEFRAEQVRAARRVLRAYERGVDVVLLDAPTGAGKTLIANMVWRGLGGAATYLATSKSLQDQFLGDYENARVLKGRANYPVAGGLYTAADCGGKRCGWCGGERNCPYQVAKEAAMAGELAVLNTAYYVAYKKGDFVRGLVVVDEAHDLEGVLMGAAEVRVTRRHMDELGVEGLVKGARGGTVLRWLAEVRESIAGERARLMGAGAELEAMVGNGDIEAGEELGELAKSDRAWAELERKVKGLSGGLEGWVRDYGDGDGSVVYKPVRVAEAGAEMIWGRGRGEGREGTRSTPKYLAMSGTFVDDAGWVDEVGVTEAGLTWETVTVASDWDASRRPLYAVGIGDMGSKGKEAGDWERVLGALVDVVRSEAGNGVLIHGVSYELCRRAVEVLRAAKLKRRILTYRNAREREEVLRKFKELKGKGPVIVAPSLDTGIDLPGDECRVQIVLKVPWPYLGDRQIAERMRAEGGRKWYGAKTVRTLVQATGRGVRSKDDWCRTYILDKQFDRIVSEYGRLLPEWWVAALVDGMPGTQLGD